MFKNFRVILRITPRDIMNFIKAAGRFLRNLLPALVFFSILLLNSSVEVFASGQLVETKPGYIDKTDPMYKWLLQYFSKHVDRGASIIEQIQSGAFDAEYFDLWYGLLYRDEYGIAGHYDFGNYDIEKIDSSTGTFSDTYIEQYHMKYNMQNFLSDHHIDWDEFAEYAKARYLYESGGGTDFDYEVQNPSKELPSVPSDLIKDVIQTTNKQYFPKNATGDIICLTDERFHNKYGSNPNAAYFDIDFYSGRWGFAPVGGGDEMYIVFYLQNGSDTYYGKWQFHFKVTTEDFWYEDRDEVEYTGYTVTCDFWDMVDGSAEKATTVSFGNNVNNSYFSLVIGLPQFLFFRSYLSYDSYISFSPSKSFNPFSNIALRNSFFVGYNSDLSASIDFVSSFSHFRGSMSNHDSSCTDYGSAHDIGYVASVSPISTIYNIDTSKIPDDYVITVNGDTVYDYSITNPVTGDTTTIDKFVINNYNFPQNSNPGGNNSGGSTSGNVTVGGQIDVSGTVSVDVNVDVNISGTGGGDGGGKNYNMPDTSFFDDYLNDALEETTGIRKFIADFFNSVPGDITKLICIGLVLAILCRLIGR